MKTGSSLDASTHSTIAVLINSLVISSIEHTAVLPFTQQQYDHQLTYASLCDMMYVITYNANTCLIYIFLFYKITLHIITLEFRSFRKSTLTKRTKRYHFSYNKRQVPHLIVRLPFHYRLKSILRISCNNCYPIFHS